MLTLTQISTLLIIHAGAYARLSSEDSQWEIDIPELVRKGYLIETPKNYVTTEAGGQLCEKIRSLTQCDAG